MRTLCLSVVSCLAISFVVVGCSNNSPSNAPSGGNTGGGQDNIADAKADASPAPVTGTMPPGAVAPSEETVKSGEYTPLSRPLFIYVNKASLQKPAVVAYLQFYLSEEGQALIPRVGYVSLSPEQMAQTRQTFEQTLQSSGAPAASDTAEGEVRIDGSSTVAPISSAMTEFYSGINRRVRAPVGTKGTSGGFNRFVKGEIDICDASRPIKESEVESCKAANIEYLELPIAIDGLTVVVNKANDWVAGMTVAQLKQIWEPESKVTKWSDVNPEWPAEPIKLFGPGTDSGTFEYFTEAVVGKSRSCRTDFQASENDNTLVNGVAGEKYGLGYFGYAYYLENRNRLKSLAIAP